MNQIREHEWKHFTSSALLTKIKCKHCKLLRITSRIDGEFIWVDEKGINYQVEPACITRTINAPLRDADK